ncbi:MAG: glycosyltransferase [Vitreimonas sp.]
MNRVAAMQRVADVRLVQPVPYMPVARPLPQWARTASRQMHDVEILHAPMLYVPGILKALDGMWLARSVAPIIHRLHRENPIDAIDAHFGYPEGAGCIRVARRLGIPVFITLRGFENEYLAKRGIGPQLAAAMRSSAGCLCVSHSLERLALRHGVEADRIRVVHNAIDTAIFAPGDRDAARRQLNLPPHRPLIVSVGHLVVRKRHHVLIDAFAKVRARHPDATLVIIGAHAFERAYPDQLVSRARALGLQDSVRFPGNLPPQGVATWLRAADTFALATAREGCCNAVLEALATGLPVVTTPAGDNTAFVQDNINGYIVPIDDAEAMSKRLTEALFRSDWNRAEISARLLRQVGDWDGVASRVLAFIDRRLASSVDRLGARAAC